ncbi:hypothetical protein SAMN06273570_1512 [Candidatus Pantoea floridensis]|uniref:Uncharacterized protein n=1 Tax=Candidatus Pantoea floridensis TaxID=1938870 RepID=A0A286BSR4_9GAMM|nr:hypothetical protein BX596_3190 [Enterobacteriaceae bacterium JKS000233]SOD37186.1 hypothetical protein SAMN06273570_1512 [Pantoea floridensis]
MWCEEKTGRTIAPVCVIIRFTYDRQLYKMQHFWQVN